MQLKRIIKSRKAISPILATLLLIVIAVAAIVVTYAWIMTYMSSAQQQAGVIPYRANVSFQPSNTIIIDIGNSGTADGNIEAIYIGSSETSMTKQTVTSPELTIPVVHKNIASVNVTYSWTQGESCYFQVIVSGIRLGPWPEQAPSA